MSKLTIKQMKKTIEAQAKKLGIRVVLDATPLLREKLYRKGRPLTEGELRKLRGAKVPVWVEFSDSNWNDCKGVYFVEKANDDECVMLEDGTCFALDFQFTGNDSASCADTEDGYTRIYEAVKKC